MCTRWQKWWRCANGGNCPFQAISSDWFQRRSEELPCCPHKASSPDLQWDQKHCHELPSSFDLNLLHDELIHLSDHLATCSSTSTEAHYLSTPKGYQTLKARKEVGNATAVIVVEGLVLFAEPALIHLSDDLIWLQACWETAFERRFKRGVRKPQAQKPSFRQYYKEHVEQAQRGCRRLYMQNVETRAVHYINANGTAAETLKLAMTVLNRSPSHSLSSVDDEEHNASTSATVCTPPTLRPPCSQRQTSVTV